MCWVGNWVDGGVIVIRGLAITTNERKRYARNSTNTQHFRRLKTGPVPLQALSDP